jgi:hypothetical protein
MLGQQGLKDVVEATDCKVFIEAERKKWTYGTVGQGLDIPRLGWAQEHHIFLSQTKDLTKNLPGRPPAGQELGPPKKVRATVLDKYPVDFLLVDDVEPEVWSMWLLRARFVNRPQVCLDGTRVYTSR